MRTGRTGRDHGVVRALEAEADGHLAASQVDQAAGDEEGADATRPLFMQRYGGIVDAADAANARADQDASAFLLFLGLWLDAGILDGLRGRSHGVDDEGVNLALLLDLHPLIGVVLAFGIVPERNTMGDLAGNIVDLEIVDTLGATLAGKDVGPGGFNTTTQRRD
jgi:hypothetical protein